MNDNQESSKNDAKEYAHKLGRDGAYLESDIENIGEILFDRLKEGEKWPSQVVLRAARYDITDPFYIEAMKISFEWFARQNEVRGMDTKQIGFLFFKNVLDAGLRYMVRENKKPMVKYGEYMDGIPVWPPPTGMPLETVEARYKDLIERLGCNGHDGAIAEIENLRKKAGLEP